VTATPVPGKKRKQNNRYKNTVDNAAGQIPNDERKKKKTQ
jgi:hypothetical protein